jgi:adenylate cyclase
VGDHRTLYAVLSGLHVYHQSRAELAVCADLAQQRLNLARGLADPSLEKHVQEAAGTIAFWRGQHARALVDFAEAISGYQAERGRVLRAMYGTDSRVVCLAYSAQCLWYLGFPEQALGRAAEAVADAQTLGDVHSLALALVFCGFVRCHCGDGAGAEPLADAAIALSSEHRLEQWLGGACFVKGLALCCLDRPAEALAAMGQGVEAFRSVGATVGVRFFAAGLGGAYLQLGAAAQGLNALEQMGRTMSVGEDSFHDADLARVHAELALAVSGDGAAAQAALERALELARSQGARSLELRVALSLARLWRRGGRAAQGKALLAPLRASFTEGAATRDLRAADVELEALG